MSCMCCLAELGEYARAMREDHTSLRQALFIPDIQPWIKIRSRSPRSFCCHWNWDLPIPPLPPSGNTTLMAF